MSLRFHAVEYEQRGGVAIVAMNNPPVNGLSHAVRLGLVAAFERAIADPTVAAIVLTGAGKAFSAGGDIRELGLSAASAAPALSLQVHPVIERCPKPTVAAVHGIAMGGGLETALVCHFRLAAADTRIALPEIKLGLIPLSGTQRLPRVLGLASGDRFHPRIEDAARARFRSQHAFRCSARWGASGSHRSSRRVRSPARAGTSVTLDRHRRVDARDTAIVLARARERAAEIGPAAMAAVEAIAAAVHSSDFDAGMQRARAFSMRSVLRTTSRRQRDRF